MTAPRVINHSIRDRLNEANDQQDGGWKYHQAIEDAIAYIAELEDELDILKEEAKGEHSMTQPGDSKMTVTPERALQGVYNAAVAMSVTNKDGAELLLKYHQTLAAALAEAKARGIMVDSFSGPASDLKGMNRTPENVLAALRKNPHLSCFDMSEHIWLQNCISALERSGKIKADTKTVQYPWIKYVVQDQPQ